MKNLFAIVVLMLSVNVFAELNSHESELVNMMKSGELRELKAAAKSISQQRIDNTEVLDVAAEILLRKYKFVYTSELDTLAWLARAVGASNNSRYYEVLSEVASNSNSKKLASHAQKALKGVPTSSEGQYKPGTAKLSKDLYPIIKQEDVDKDLIEMIYSGELSDLKNAAKRTVSTGTQSQAVGDGLAEVLLTLYPLGLDYQADTLAWVSRALGGYESGRYKDVLKEVSDNAPMKAVKKHAAKAYKANKKSTAEQYKKGTIKLEKTSYY